MKAMILIHVFVAMFATAQGQILVNGQDINTIPDLQYIELNYTEGSASGTKNRKGMVSIDIGQDYDKASETLLKGKDGEVLKFNSLAEVLNLFNKNGWVYRDTVTKLTSAGSRNSIIMERKTE